MKESKELKNLKARARRATHGQYPYIDRTALAPGELQSLMDGMHPRYTVVCDRHAHALRYDAAE